MTASRQTDQIAELDASFYDEPAGGESTENHDFDAWWAERAASRPTTTILGVTVPIPSQVPAEIMLKPDKAMGLTTDDAEEIGRLLVLMLDLTGIDGQATLDGWLADGLGSEQLIILFTWALLNGMRPPGKPAVSFARVAQVVDEANDGPKAPEPTNRAGRRAASRTAASPKKTAKPAAKKTAGRK